MQASSQGWINGFLGVAIFAGSLPATRVAVMEVDPYFLTGARAVIAATLGLALLWLTRQAKPARRDLPSLLAVAAGVVLGFPLLTALALQHITSAHAIVFVGLLPLSTALFSTLRSHDKPKPLFWCFSLLGALIIAAYAARHGLGLSLKGDLLMLAAVALCGLGYAEGASLTRRLGGWQVISWGLILALPPMLLMAWLHRPGSWVAISLPAWLALGYVSLFSMLIGFVFWYRGLAQGGIAAVGQLQLLQPFMGLLLAAWVLHETVDAWLLLATLGAVCCVAGAKRYA